MFIEVYSNLYCILQSNLAIVIPWQRELIFMSQSISYAVNAILFV